MIANLNRVRAARILILHPRFHIVVSHKDEFTRLLRGHGLTLRA